MTLPASLYECTSCRYTWVADAVVPCIHCGKDTVTRKGATSAPFDPFAYNREWRDHPERFGSLAKMATALVSRRQEKP